MNTKAIYTVHENGKEHYFFSEHAGGFSYPFAVADFLHSLNERQLFVPGRNRGKRIVYCG